MAGIFNSIVDTIDPSKPHTTTTGAIVDTIDPAQDHVTTTSGATSSLNGLGSGLSGLGGAPPPSGGMASSPNVPAPGSSIDPSTGLPHTAGLTRAELDARKASAVEGAQSSGLLGGLGTSSNVPTPGSTINPDTGLPHTAGITRAELDARKASAVGGAQSSGLMGGLGTSSNVPAPGSSINPDTGLPHTAGITRAELEAIKAKGQGLLDTPAGAASHPPVDMSGREQAAAQLVGGGLPRTAGGVSPTVGSGSIIDDIEKTATRLGQKAYEAVPVAVKDMFAEPKGKGVEGSPIKPRRGSAAALFENVRATATNAATNLATTVQNAVIYDPDLHPPAPTIQPSYAPHSGLKDGSVPPATNLSVREELNPNRRGSIIDTVTQQAKKITSDVSAAMQNAVTYDPDSPHAIPTSTANKIYPPVGAGASSGLKDGSVQPITGLSVKEELNPNRRGSIIDTVTQQAKKISADVQHAMESGRYDITGSSVKTPTTATGTTNTESGGVLASVKGFISDAFQAAPDSPANTYTAGPAQRYAFGTVPIAPRSTGASPAVAQSSTIPSHPQAQENQVARPGEVSGGGLGSAPEEVKIGDDLYGQKVYSADSAGSSGNQTSSTPAPIATTDRTAPEVKIGDDVYGKEVYSADSTPVAAPTSTTTTAVADDSHRNISTGSYGLAAALPATVLGAGAAHGATKIAAVPGVSEKGTEVAPTSAASALQSSPEDGLHSSTTDTAHSTSTPVALSNASTADGLHPSTATATRGGVDRQHSLSSVTAIRHGTEGDRNHEGEVAPLATIRSGESDEKIHHATGTDGSVLGSAGTGVAASSVGTSTPATSTTASTPTKVTTAIPATTSTPSKNSAATTSTPTKSTTTTPVKSTLAVPTTPQNTSAHGRAGSSGSTGKKVGFMQKLKGEAKIISGKLKNDEAKVKLGEKIKHGEA